MRTHTRICRARCPAMGAADTDCKWC